MSETVSREVSEKPRLGRPPKRGPRAAVTMSWSLDLIAATNAYSEETGISRNDIVDQAVREYLEKQRDARQ